MLKYGVSSGPYFPVFGLNTGKYGPEETPYLSTFHSVLFTLTCLYLFTLTHPYLCYEFDKIGKIWEIQILRRNFSSIDGDYLETATGGVL